MAIKLEEVDVQDILCDMHESFELVSETVEGERRWSTEYLVVIRSGHDLFGFNLCKPKGEQNDWSDVNHFPIECFKVEVDPSIRYRRKTS